MGKIYKLFRLLVAVCCAACAAYAQGVGAPATPAPAAPDRPVVKNLEIRSGARGMILMINGSGPLALGEKPANFEKATAKYRDFRVNIAGAAYAQGASATFNPPPELPVKDIVLTNVASGLTIAVKMRNMVNGPIDVKNSDNQIRILLTRTALPEIVWSSEKGVISALPLSVPPPSAPPPPAALPAGAAVPARKTPGVPKVASKAETPQTLSPEPDIPHSGVVTKKTPEGELVRYKVFGRDPFVPLLRDTSATALPSVENLKLVGVLEDARERIALVEDFKNGNRAFALRANDAVAQGKVLRVHRDKVVFLIRDFEVSHSYTLGLSK